MQHIGVDIIEIERVRKACERWGDRFLTRVFTAAEIHLYGNRYASLAARFAAKEAVLKALNACDNGITWQEIEILAGPTGKPTVTLKGKALKAARALPVRELDVSLSHSETHAIAFAVGVSGPAVRRQ